MKYKPIFTEKGVRIVKEDYYIKIPQKWWRIALKGLKPIERCLLISLRVWGAIRPSKSKLARELGVSRNSVVKYLKKLREKGYL